MYCPVDVCLRGGGWVSGWSRESQLSIGRCARGAETPFITSEALWVHTKCTSALMLRPRGKYCSFAHRCTFSGWFTSAPGAGLGFQTRRWISLLAHDWRHVDSRGICCRRTRGILWHDLRPLPCPSSPTVQNVCSQLHPQVGNHRAPTVQL